MNKKFNYNKIVVHNGLFHADDVLCVAMAKTLNPDIEVIRTRDKQLLQELNNDENAIICDVGYGKYDHHQDDAERKSDGSKYAACGLFFREFKEELFENPENHKEFKEMLNIVEHLDNGEGDLSLQKTERISRFCHAEVPTWDSNESLDDRFNEAVHYITEYVKEEQEQIPSNKAKKEIDSLTNIREKEIEKTKEKANEIITAEFRASNGIVVEIGDDNMPWRDTLCPTTAQFIIYEAPKGQMNLQAVPPEPTSFDQKVSIPSNFLEGSLCYRFDYCCGISLSESGMTAEEAKTMLHNAALELVKEHSQEFNQEDLENLIDNEIIKPTEPEASVNEKTLE